MVVVAHLVAGQVPMDVARGRVLQAAPAVITHPQAAQAVQVAVVVVWAVTTAIQEMEDSVATACQARWVCWACRATIWVHLSS